MVVDELDDEEVDRLLETAQEDTGVQTMDEVNRFYLSRRFTVPPMSVARFFFKISKGKKYVFEGEQ